MIRLSRCATVVTAGLSCGAILAATNAPGGEAKATTDQIVLSRSLPAMKGNDLKSRFWRLCMHRARLRRRTVTPARSSRM